MKQLRHVPLFLILLLLFAPMQAADSVGLQKDPAIEKRIDDLLSKMTLEEKVGQTIQYNGVSDRYLELIRQGRIGSLLNVKGAEEVNKIQRVAIEQSRLKIPLIFGFDVIHGYRTVFPIPLAETASWNPELARRTAAVAAQEASAAGLHWTFAPMVDIARDARWGRIAEGAGEDPYLGSAFATARVHGFQGTGMRGPSSVVACVKHYVGYGAAEGGRDYNSVDMSEIRLREVYLPPFKAAIDAGVGTLMSSFNDLNGIPATANGFTLNQILRKEWGFNGFVVSDWNSVGELLIHGVAANKGEAARKALTAGVDMDMEGSVYIDALGDQVRRGAVPEAALNEAVRRILRIKFMAGLFEKPYVDPKRESAELLTAAHRTLALDAARQSIVLLKNAPRVLPLAKTVKRVALIGPLADDKVNLLGSWAGDGKPEDVVSVHAGLKNRLGPGVQIVHVKGAEVEGTSKAGFEQATSAARTAEVAILVLGEKADMSGEAASRAELDLPGVQNELLQAVIQTGTPTVLVLMNGRPLTLNWAASNARAIVEAWFLGIEAGNAIADVLVGNYNPSGKLPVSFPRAVGQVPIYYSQKSTGRPSGDQKFTSRYLDVPHTPLFPFGFGLGYSRFQYSDLRLSARSIAKDGFLKVNATVKNAGDQEGIEVVQLYIRDLAGSTTRPVKELKGFQRISLKGGESKQIQFTLGPDELAMYNAHLKRVVEPGAFHVWVGPSSAEGLEGSFEVK